ncbi:DUF1254 domain-containing protein [Flammeovirga pectinis]|uniref:DUF1254 domain-containing protein n=1 Tax=Flammeovirga pectinis TaxID=2494373 RepID=A0A3S9NYG8_9BACT|nr:DUF1214 domain-containing protein [Flammeovirga pectinis]AZQ60896.1 DUF1254 domain-containing protein [Flammeovirga pectinis]
MDVVAIGISIMLMTVFAFESGSPFRDKPNDENEGLTYKANVPDKILIPDLVTTNLIGDLNFKHALPTEETIDKVRYFMDLSKVTQSFTKGITIASTYAILEGIKDAGTTPGDLLLTTNFNDARFIALTPNRTTSYALGELNLKVEPWIVEINPKIIGTVNDAFMSHVLDMNISGQEQNIKYLFVGPDYTGSIPKGYKVSKSKSYRNWIFLRLLEENNSSTEAIQLLKEGCKMYPLSKANIPSFQKFIDANGLYINTVHANNEDFFTELNAMVQYESETSFDAELVRLFASIGIKKDKAFTPNKRMQTIFKEGAAIGNAYVRANVINARDKEAFLYPEKRQWFTGILKDLNNTENTKCLIDDLPMYHFLTAGNTNKFANAVYAISATDVASNHFDGGKTYTLTLPANIPTENNWSVIVYDNHTRSLLETNQLTAGIDSQKENIKSNKDGSYTLWFGPKAPKGKLENWIQTIPNNGFYTILRINNPTDRWFNKSWIPGDLTLSNNK